MDEANVASIVTPHHNADDEDDVPIEDTEQSTPDDSSQAAVQPVQASASASASAPERTRDLTSADQLWALAKEAGKNIRRANNNNDVAKQALKDFRSLLRSNTADEIWKYVSRLDQTQTIKITEAATTVVSELLPDTLAQIDGLTRSLEQAKQTIAGLEERLREQQGQQPQPHEDLGNHTVQATRLLRRIAAASSGVQAPANAADLVTDPIQSNQDDPNWKLVMYVLKGLLDDDSNMAVQWEQVRELNANEARSTALANVLTHESSRKSFWAWVHLLWMAQRSYGTDEDIMKELALDVAQFVQEHIAKDNTSADPNSPILTRVLPRTEAIPEHDVGSYLVIRAGLLDHYTLPWDWLGPESHVDRDDTLDRRRGHLARLPDIVGAIENIEDLIQAWPDDGTRSGARLDANGLMIVLNQLETRIQSINDITQGALQGLDTNNWATVRNGLGNLLQRVRTLSNDQRRDLDDRLAAIPATAEVGQLPQLVAANNGRSILLNQINSTAAGDTQLILPELVGRLLGEFRTSHPAEFDKVASTALDKRVAAAMAGYSKVAYAAGQTDLPVYRADPKIIHPWLEYMVCLDPSAPNLEGEATGRRIIKAVKWVGMWQFPQVPLVYPQNARLPRGLAQTTLEGVRSAVCGFIGLFDHLGRREDLDNARRDRVMVGLDGATRRLFDYTKTVKAADDTIYTNQLSHLQSFQSMANSILGITGHGDTTKKILQQYATDALNQGVTAFGHVKSALTTGMFAGVPLQLYLYDQRMATVNDGTAAAANLTQVQQARLGNLLKQRIPYVDPGWKIGNLIVNGWDPTSAFLGLNVVSTQALLDEIARQVDQPGGSPQRVLRHLGDLVLQRGDEPRRAGTAMQRAQQAQQATMERLQKHLNFYIDTGERVLRAVHPTRTDDDDDLPNSSTISDILQLVERVGDVSRPNTRTGSHDDRPALGAAVLLRSLGGSAMEVDDRLDRTWAASLQKLLLNTAEFWQTIGNRPDLDDLVIAAELHDRARTLGPLLAWGRHRQMPYNRESPAQEPSDVLADFFSSDNRTPDVVHRVMGVLGPAMVQAVQRGTTAHDTIQTLQRLVAADGVAWPTSGPEAGLRLCLAAGAAWYRGLQEDPWFRGLGSSSIGNPLTNNELALAIQNVGDWFEDRTKEDWALAETWAAAPSNPVQLKSSDLLDGWTKAIDALAHRNTFWDRTPMTNTAVTSYTVGALRVGAWVLDSMGTTQVWSAVGTRALADELGQCIAAIQTRARSLAHDTGSWTLDRLRAELGTANQLQHWTQSLISLLDSHTVLHGWLDNRGAVPVPPSTLSTVLTSAMGCVEHLARARSVLVQDVRPALTQDLIQMLAAAMKHTTFDAGTQSFREQSLARALVAGLTMAFGWQRADGTFRLEQCDMDNVDAHLVPLAHGWFNYVLQDNRPGIAEEMRTAQLVQALDAADAVVVPILSVRGSDQSKAMLYFMQRVHLYTQTGPRWDVAQRLWEWLNNPATKLRSARELKESLQPLLAALGNGAVPPLVAELETYWQRAIPLEEDQYAILQQALPPHWLDARARVANVDLGALNKVLTVFDGFVPLRASPDGRLLGDDTSLNRTLTELRGRLSAIDVSRAVLGGSLHNTEVILHAVLDIWHNQLVDANDNADGAKMMTTYAQDRETQLDSDVGSAQRAAAAVYLMRGMRSTPSSVIVTSLRLAWVLLTPSLALPLLSTGGAELAFDAQMKVIADALDLMEYGPRFGQVRDRLADFATTFRSSMGGHTEMPNLLLNSDAALGVGLAFWNSVSTNEALLSQRVPVMRDDRRQQWAASVGDVKDAIQTALGPGVQVDDSGDDAHWDPPIERWPTAQVILARPNLHSSLAVLVWLAARTVDWLRPQLPTWAELSPRLNAESDLEALGLVALATYLLQLPLDSPAIPTEAVRTAHRLSPHLARHCFGVPLSVPDILATNLRGLHALEVLDPTPTLDDLASAGNVRCNARALWLTWLHTWANSVDPDRAATFQPVEMWRPTEKHAWRLATHTWRATNEAQRAVGGLSLNPVQAKRTLTLLRRQTANHLIAVLDVQLHADGQLSRLAWLDHLVVGHATAQSAPARAAWRLARRIVLALVPLMLGGNSTPRGLSALVGDDWQAVAVLQQQSVLLSSLLQLYRQWMLLLAGTTEPTVLADDIEGLRRALVDQLPRADDPPTTTLRLSNWTLVLSQPQLRLVRRLVALGLIVPVELPAEGLAETPFSDYETALLVAAVAAGQPLAWHKIVRSPESVLAQSGPWVGHHSVPRALLEQQAWGPQYQPLSLPATDADAAELPWLSLLLASEAAVSRDTVPLSWTELRWVMVDAARSTLLLNSGNAPEAQHVVPLGQGSIQPGQVLLARLLALYVDASDAQLASILTDPRHGGMSPTQAKALWAWLRLIPTEFALGHTLTGLQWDAARVTPNQAQRVRLRLTPTLESLSTVLPENLSWPRPWLIQTPARWNLPLALVADVAATWARDRPTDILTPHLWWRAILPGVACAYWRADHGGSGGIPPTTAWPSDATAVLVLVLALMMDRQAGRPHHPQLLPHRAWLGDLATRPTALAPASVPKTLCDTIQQHFDTDLVASVLDAVAPLSIIVPVTMP